MIYEHDDGTYTISSGGVWIQGVYESRRAANYAFKCSPDQIAELNKNGVIKFTDIQKIKRLAQKGQ